jgi:CMP-N-acetylneuraminic acid synthetase
MRAYALIPARSGSQGLPDKNILPAAGHPMLAYSVAFASRIPVERILLSTDSPRYAPIGRAYGAETPGLRGPAASGHTAMEEDILADLDAALPRHGIPLPDIWVWLKPTCPFRDAEAVAAAIALLRDRPEVVSVRLVSEADARLHRINEEGWLEPLLESWDPARSKMRRSEFPKVYQPFNLEIFRHEGWRRRGALFMGRRIHPIVLPRITGLDVDDLDGFELIRTLLEARPRPELIARHVPLPQPPPPGAGLPFGHAGRKRAFDAADAEGRVGLLAGLLHAEEGPFCQPALNLVRRDPAAMRAACQRVLADFPAHRIALRCLALTLNREGDFAAARETLLRLLDIWPEGGLDDPRELLRLDLLGAAPDAAAREEDWARHGGHGGEVSRLSYLAQRAVAEGRRPDLAALEEAIAARREAALAELAGAAAAGHAPARAALDWIERLRDARSVALVGNAPCLAGDGAGQAIEAHALVLRFNYPVLRGFEADAGCRTDLILFAAAHRARLAKRIGRDPAYAKTPSMGTHAMAPNAEGPLPPGMPASLLRLIAELSYGRATTGFRGVVLASLILGRPPALFGFDSFRPGGRGHYYGEGGAPFTHEMDYERWFVEHFLPRLRPGLRLHGGPGR